MNPWIEIGAEGLLVFLQLRLAFRSLGVTRIILAGQAIFSGLSFIARPVYLLIAQPDSPVLLGDIRLQEAGYNSGVSRTLFLVIVSQTVFTFVVYLRLANAPKVGASVQPDAKAFLFSKNFFVILYVFYALGWIGRWASLEGNLALYTALSPFAIAGASLIICYWKLPDGKLVPLQSLLLLGIEVGWALLRESKAAAFIPLVALALRWVELSRNQKSLVLPFAALLSSGLGFFFLIQSLRGITNSTVADVRSSGGVNPLQSYAISLVERFDGFNAYTDAYWANNLNGWISVQDFILRLFSNLLPKGPFLSPTDVYNLQFYWAREVASQSVSNQFQSVSLASGPGAEGFALAGFPGLILLSALFAAITVWCVNLFDSGNQSRVIFSTFVIFSPALFEQGVLGLAIALNKGLQILIAFAVLNYLFSHRSQKNSRTTTSVGEQK